jgi:hypothetical protein
VAMRPEEFDLVVDDPILTGGWAGCIPGVQDEDAQGLLLRAISRSGDQRAHIAVLTGRVGPRAGWRFQSVSASAGSGQVRPAQ